MSYADALWEVAATQHGVVTTRDAEDAGVPPVELRKMASRGTLHKLSRGVYQHPLVPVDRFTEGAAALASVGDAYLEWDTILSLYDLAHVNPPLVHLGLRGRNRRALPEHVRVTTRRVARQDSEAGAIRAPRVHGPEPLAERDLTHHEGLLGVTVARALLDAIGRIPTDRVVDAAKEAAGRGLLTPLEEAELTVALLQLADRESHPPFQQIG